MKADTASVPMSATTAADAGESPPPEDVQASGVILLEELRRQADFQVATSERTDGKIGAILGVLALAAGYFGARPPNTGSPAAVVLGVTAGISAATCVTSALICLRPRRVFGSVNKAQLFGAFRSMKAVDYVSEVAEGLMESIDKTQAVNRTKSRYLLLSLYSLLATIALVVTAAWVGG